MLENGISLETKYADNVLKLASYVVAQNVRKQKFVPQRINCGANKLYMHHKQGVVPMSSRFGELEGRVGLL